MTKLWAIVKGVIVFFTFAGIVTAAVTYVLSTQNTSTTLSDDVVPMLNYLVRADSASRARDAIMLARIDSNKVVVDKLARDYVEKITSNPDTPIEEVLRKINGLYQYIDVKKNCPTAIQSKQKPENMRLDSHP